MAARVPSVLNAAIEVAFVTAAGVAGFVRAPFWSAFALAAAMIAYWAFNRRTGLVQLGELGAARLAGAVVVSLAVMGAVLAGAYGIGHLMSGSAS